ncbi:MAG: AAA family ATPase [Nitrospirae bacterium]|nr:AAA family ATPase [Nitrospirota bacterium]
MPSQFTVKNFFGRDHELEILRNIYREARSGDATGIFLSGRNGIGKTELLRQAYYHLFNDQNEAVPFFYTFKTAFTSTENFSKDYLCSFILQNLAFLKKNLAMIDACIYSLEDLTRFAKESGAQWAVDLVNDYTRIKDSGDPLKLFSFAVSAPSRCYLSTGLPVIVMIDDFHKIRKFCELNPVDGNRHYWTLFEVPVKFRYTPHIFSGNKSELDRMFFEDTLFGEYLELFNLTGLGHDNTRELFAALSQTYGLNVRTELDDFIDLFDGNPFYIKNFIQAARQAGSLFSPDDLWLVYFNEITRGKTFKYWTSILKTYIPQFDLRKPSLRVLDHLYESGPDAGSSNLSEALSIGHEDLEHVMNLLHNAGVVETAFSETEPVDDKILIDVIKGLYLREIEKSQSVKIKDALMGDKRQQVRVVDTSPSYDMTIPAEPKSVLVALRAVESMGKSFNMPPHVVGQLQVALSDLFANVIGTSEPASENCNLKFRLKENTFFAEVAIPRKDFVLQDNDCNRIKSYLNDLQVETVPGGTKITLLKEIGKDSVPAPEQG